MAPFTRAVLSLLAASQANAGIYPSGHFDFVTKLTTANVNDEIKKAVDAGKTMFVRTIASEG